jgi:tRNA-2-methylthio-N6-dimethylallyladenosine synthase
LEEVREAVEGWAKEINLIGQNVNSYGKQFVDKKLWNEEKSSWDIGLWKSPFRELLEWIDSLWVERLRFTSSNPHDMTNDILDAHFDLSSPCNYLHFALQSWSNHILKKMNRKHKYEDFKKQVDYLRSRDSMFAISTDIIVGYSWETEEMFQETLRAVEECEFDFVYNARYSVRPWTIAAKLYPDDIPNEVKAERWHRLNNLMKLNVEKRSKIMIGRQENILICWEKDNQFFWRTRNFKEVFFTKKSGINIWDIVPVEIIALDKWVLNGKLV